ncbi:3-dehydroquinate dehydratase [Georgenia soli]|uniref:3-dehydroquinate dehydratase n=1 Tax=Georgenia soli TaxID=638953 RepID=A0A2A9EJP3_9MICO|nr:type I 3-dehydroquinate dehydratase [Georgenia soli]PFG38449.1 3-dehydroquinate dehydratase [Georgenia soli]
MGSTAARPVRVKDVTIGDGRPVVIVPVLGATPAELRAQVVGLSGRRVDVVEWRVDHFAALTDIPAVLDAARALVRLLGPVPLLVTCRTRTEGGVADLDPQSYGELLSALASSGAADLLDVEHRRPGDVVAGIVTAARRHGVKVVASEHDFTTTPPAEEIVRRLREMQELGVDLAKIAVMPRSRADVLALLDATRQVSEEHPEVPVITMSMGPLGVVSRLAGHLFGSAATFASAGTASAPGQVDVEGVRTVLDVLDRAQGAGAAREPGPA